MEIIRTGSKPSGVGGSDWSTGTVRIDPLFNPIAPERVQGANVTFEPDARTAWHTHPLGQTPVVTSGLGRVQRWGVMIEEIYPVTWFFRSSRKTPAWRWASQCDDPFGHP